MSAAWIETDREVYRAVYDRHVDQFQVFGTITDDGAYSGSRHIMTEWGFKNADEPLIKSEGLDGVWRYYIASITKDEA